MGTRNLTCVVRDGEFVVAQYGQWDGYPSGQGATVLSFLQTTDWNEFVKRLDQVRWLTEEEVEKINSEIDEQTEGKALPDLYPWLSRDAGADVLSYIGNLSEGEELALRDAHAFAGDSLFCEWAYVIDVNNAELSVYRGFNQDPEADNGIFANFDDLEDSESYEPVRLVTTYNVTQLPSLEDFIAELDPPEEDDE